MSDTAFGPEPPVSRAPDTEPKSEQAATDAASIPRGVYLDKLLRNIAVMLDFANKSGITLPDDLGQKLDALLISPEVAAHKDMFAKT